MAKEARYTVLCMNSFRILEFKENDGDNISSLNTQIRKSVALPWQTTQLYITNINAQIPNEVVFGASLFLEC